MAWCKTDLKVTFSGEFFPSKVPEFLHDIVLFNLVVKHTPLFFRWFALRVREKRGQNIEACTMNATKRSIEDHFSQKIKEIVLLLN